MVRFDETDRTGKVNERVSRDLFNAPTPRSIARSRHALEQMVEAVDFASLSAVAIPHAMLSQLMVLCLTKTANTTNWEMGRSLVCVTQLR
jgi:hypothetical protein